MKIFVGCSSRDELEEKYYNLAMKVSEKLSNHELVIGGTSVGMMQCVASKFPSEKITQIILKDYLEEGMSFTNEVLIPETSFERMNLIWDRAEAFLFLPGGTGTLGEMISFLEENRMREQKKKLYLFNFNHFYDEFLSFIEKLKKEHFSNDDLLDGLYIIRDMNELEELL